jgi:hypothetical protein
MGNIHKYLPILKKLFHIFSSHKKGHGHHSPGRKTRKF